MTLRVAQFFLKIAHLSFSMGPRGPRAYGLRPRLWLLTCPNRAGKYYLPLTNSFYLKQRFHPQIWNLEPYYTHQRSVRWTQFKLHHCLKRIFQELSFEFYRTGINNFIQSLKSYITLLDVSRFIIQWLQHCTTEIWLYYCDKAALSLQRTK